MTRHARSARLVAAAIAAVVVSAAPARQAAADTVVVDAFSVCSGSGAALPSGPGRHVFAGEMSGPYFVDTGQGPMPAERITCLGMLEADDATGRQTRRGHCRFEARDGAVAYGAFDCEGWRLIGSSGPFTLVGGEGRMAGVTGERPITIRRSDTAFAASDGRVAEAALGIAFWKGFALTAATSR